jgi:hypothetical protein
VQRPAPPWSDQISLDIELYQVAHAKWRHQQDLDSHGQLGPDRPSSRIPVPSSLTHQLNRERQQCGDVSPIIEWPQPCPINFRQSASTRCETANDAPHLIQMALFDEYMMSGDSLQAARKICNCGRGRAACAVEKKAKSVLEGFDAHKILQRSEGCRIAAHVHQGRGKAADLPFPMSEGRRPHRSEWRVRQEIAPGEPVAPQ